MSATTPTARTRLLRRPGLLSMWLLLPAAVFLAVAFFYPLIASMITSFNEPSWGFQTYRELLHDGVTVRVLVRTVVTAALIATIALVLAYPYAYAMTQVGKRARRYMILIVLLPFWTSIMARTFAWYLLEQEGGLLERAFSLVGFDDVVLLGTLNGVAIAMVQVMLPFMVLPLYSGMVGVDLRLLDAAQSLGASRAKAFRTVYFPLTLPAVSSGFILVFILSLGFYVTPVVLGSPREALLSQVIGTKVFRLLDFAGASAMGALLLLVTIVILIAIARIVRPVTGVEGMIKDD